MKSLRLLLLLPLFLLAATGARAQNPGDTLIIPGRVVSFVLTTGVMVLDIQDPTTGASTQQTFLIPPATPIVDAAGQDISINLDGLDVQLEVTFGTDGLPLIQKIVVATTGGTDPPPGGTDPPPTDPPTTAGEPFGGIVKSNNGTTLQLEDWDETSQSPFTFNVTLAADGKVFSESGAEIALSQILVGHFAGGSGEKQADGSYIAFDIHDGGPADTGGSTDPPPGGTDPPPGGGGHQPGEQFPFGGKVESLGTGFMILSSEDFTTGEVYFDTVYFDAVIVRDPENNPVTLKAGDMIDGTVEVQADGKLKFISITVYPPPTDPPTGGGTDPPPGGTDPPPTAGEPFGGIVKVNDGITLQLEGWDSTAQATFTFNVTLAADGKVFSESEAEIALSQILVGHFAGGSGEKQADGSFIAYDIHDGGLPPDTGGSTDPPPGGGGPQPGEQFQFGGQVESLGSGFMILLAKDDQTGEEHRDTVYYDAGIASDLDGNSVTLNTGDFIDGTVEVQADGTFKFIAITVYPPPPAAGTIFPTGGKVEFVGVGFLVLSWNDETAGKSGIDTLKIPTGFVIVDEAGNPATPLVGQYVDGQVEIQADGSMKLIELIVYPEDDHDEPEDSVAFHGVIVAVGTDYLDVEVDDEDTLETYRLMVDNQTQFLDETGSILFLSDFAVNDSIVGIVDATDENNIVAKLIKKGSLDILPPTSETQPFQGGVLVGIGTDYFDIQLIDPETNQLDTTRVKFDSQTDLKDENENPITVNDFAVGDEVFGEVRIVDDSGNITVTLIVMFRGSGSVTPPTGDQVAGGTILEIGSDYLVVLTLNPETGDTATVRLQVDAQTVFLNTDSSAITLGDFAVNEQVFGVVTITSTGEVLAKTISRMTGLPGQPTAEINFTGQIIRRYNDQIFVKGLSPTGIDYFLRVIISSGTELTDENGNSLDAGSFAAGDRVHGDGDLTADFAVSAARLAKGDGDNFTLGQKIPFSGIITEVGSDYFVSEYGHPPLTKRNNTNAQTLITTSSGAATSLKVGDFIKSVSIIESDGSQNVLEVVVYDGILDPPGIKISLQGQIVDVGADYLVIQDPAEGELKVLILENTVDEQGNPVSAGNYRTGDTFNAGGVIQACELVILTEVISQQQSEISIKGIVTETGPDFIMIDGTDPDGQPVVGQMAYDSSTVFLGTADEILPANSFAAGDSVTGSVLPGQDGSFYLVSIKLLPSTAAAQADTLDFQGEVVELGEGFIDISTTDSAGQQIVMRGNIVGNVRITGEDSIPVTLQTGDQIRGRGIWYEDRGFELLFVIRQTAEPIMPLPGDFVELEGQITEISGNRVNLSFTGPDTLLTSAWLDITAETELVTSFGAPIELGWLEAGDVLGAQGTVNQDSVSVTASKLTYLEGTLRLLTGRVVGTGSSSFELETRLQSGQSVVAQVAISDSTIIVRQGSGEQLDASGIISGAQVVVVARRQAAGNSFNAIRVSVPEPERADAGGRVVAIETDRFRLEIQDPGESVTTRATVLVSGTTVWRQETDSGLQPTTFADLKVDDLVHFSGIHISPLTASADTVIILDTGDLEVHTFTVLDGKIENSVFTFQFDFNEDDPGQQPAVTSVSLNVSPDFANLAGQIDFSPIGQTDAVLSLVKVSGTSGVLSGRWSGFSQQGEDAKVLVEAELNQSGTSVTGTITSGGQAGPGGDNMLEPGDEVFIGGQVTSVENGTVIISFLNQLNQHVDRPVIVHSGTEIVDVNGNQLNLPIDSLLARDVNVKGILQDNLTVVATRIKVFPLPGDDDISITLPPLLDFTWNESNREVGFGVSGSDLDNISSETVSFLGHLSNDGGALRLNAMAGADSLHLVAKRLSGDLNEVDGEWTGFIRTVVSERTKVWPLFLGLAVHDGQLNGVYELGESRFRAEVTTQNGPPEIAEFQPVTVTEGQAVTVQVTASDPDGDPVTLTVHGVPFTGSSFTDNGDGTGTYNLTIPQLAAGRTELLVTFVADDGKGGKTSRVLKIQVTRLNRLPELLAFNDTLRLLEGKPFSVTIPARDADGGELEFEYADLPAWSSTVANQISFDPPFGSAGVYSITVTVEDEDEGKASMSYVFRVIAANRHPRFVQIEPIKVEAGSPVSFTLQANDPDIGDVLTLSLAQVSGVDALPAGASFDAAGGQFNWTPTALQFGPFKAGFVVTDSDGARGKMAVTIFVGQTVTPPTLVVPDSLSVNQGESASFTASGQSSTGEDVLFLARGLPRGAHWSSEGDSLQWFPAFDQQGKFVVTMSASDGRFRTDKDVVITVNPVEQIPVLEPLENYTVSEGQLLRFRVKGRYPNGHHVVFDPPVGLPANSGFDPITGSFRFLPDFSQAGTYNLNFVVTATDGTTNAVSNSIEVTDKNRAPRLGRLDNVSLTTGEAVAFTVPAADPDAGDVLTFTVANLPSGATFDTSVNPPAFSWTPAVEGSFEVSFTVTDQAQANDRASVIISVGTQNLPPSLGQIGDVTVAEGDTLVLSVSVSDPEGADVSVFVTPVPVNANFDNDANTFTFEPSFSQAGSYSLKFVASDGVLTDEERVTITVVDVPRPPTISVPPNWAIFENDQLQFTVSVRDASGNRVPVLSSNLPPGASLDPQSGKFNWTPNFEQAGEYQLTFNASDGNQKAQAGVKILVQDRNRNPELFIIDNQELIEGNVISFEISSIDPDGDEVTIGIDSSGTPYINSAEIRNNSVFVFNTALLDSTTQIPSAVFKVTAADSRGGADTMRIEFKIIRQDDVSVPNIPAGGDPFNYGFPGTGLSFTMTYGGSGSISGQVTGSETSGTLSGGTGGGGVLLAAANSKTDLSGRYPQLAGSKDKVKVMPFLSAEGSVAGDFYGVRRGWGLDLSSDLLGGLSTLQFELTLSYQDRDIPATDIPEFLESAISIFGLDASGNFVQIATQLDTVANTATAQADLALYTDFTLGVILDLVEPVISFTSKLVSTTDESGPYNVITTIVDNVLIRTARLYYSIDGTNYSYVEMQPDTLLINGFTGDIPGQREGNTVRYYIETSDEEHTVTDPANAPQSAYQFAILLDGVEGVTAGDANGDGKIDIFDLLEVLSILSGKSVATPGADADGNGSVNIFDLLEVLSLLGSK